MSIAFVAALSERSLCINTVDFNSHKKAVLAGSTVPSQTFTLRRRPDM